jgi:proteasome lid subunit RPN8/RPN11
MTLRLSEGQRQAVASLTSIAERSGGDLLIDSGSREMIGAWLGLRVWLACDQIPGSAAGVPLANREPVDILIPADFPFRPPMAGAGHTRFAGQPHVQWGSELCLYASASDWDPSAGMVGFLRRLLGFYHHVAMGTLSGPQAPWDPPVAYADAKAGCVVIRADLAPTDRERPGSFLRWAVGVQVDADRADVVDWLDFSFDGYEPADLISGLVGELREARARSGYDNAFLVPAVILPEPIAWEYPDSVLGLLAAVRTAGTKPGRVLMELGLTMLVNRKLRSAASETGATYLLVRAPADKRFTTADAPAHFAAWRLVPEDEAALSVDGGSGQMLRRLRTWLEGAEISWARVYDDRSDVVLRRDIGRPAGRLRRATVLVLGCGAIGAPIAEHCVRAGASTVHFVDWGTIHPGILVRQPYDYVEIGLPKAEALAYRLGRIRPDTSVLGIVRDVSSFLKVNESALGMYDLIIDATADRSVSARIERLRRDHPYWWPELATVGISQSARYGIAAVTPHGSVGAGIDMFRHLALATVEDPALSDVYSEFFPEERIEFEPERGCSGTTFIGSHTDVTALAAQMLDSALVCASPSVHVSRAGEAVYTPREKALCIVRLGDGDDGKPARSRLNIPHDRLIADRSGTYQVRLNQGALEQMRQAVRKSAAAECPGETGGLLLGQFDDACGVAWVSEATEPPAGSFAGLDFIVVNSPKAREAVRERSRQTHGLISFMGLWHTHPDAGAEPSSIDNEAMVQLLAQATGPFPRILVIILGAPGPEASLVGRDGEDWSPDIYAKVLAG